MEYLPIDIFIKEITYLPFDSVVNICQTDKILHIYCTDGKYNTHWKKLIDDTFSSIDNYGEKLTQIWKDLNVNDKYDYLVYTQLVNYLDPITQAMIYYRQGDMNSFDKRFTKTQQFLALFLLNKKDIIKNYLPNKIYLPFIKLLNGKKLFKPELNWMLREMAEEGNLKGINLFENLGADISSNNDYPLHLASSEGHLEVVKYLISKGADIRSNNDYALRASSKNGHLDVVKYLIQNGANIHVDNDAALIAASSNGHLDVVEYLKSLP